MKQYVKRTQRDYSLSFKLAVVEQVEKGEMTYRQAQERFGIQGCSTVLNWLRKYGQLDWHSSAQHTWNSGLSRAGKSPYKARGEGAADGAEKPAWQDAADPSLRQGNTVLLSAVPVGA